MLTLLDAELLLKLDELELVKLLLELELLDEEPDDSSPPNSMNSGAEMDDKTQ